MMELVDIRDLKSLMSIGRMSSTPIVATMNKLLKILTMYSAIVGDYDINKIYQIADKITNNINSKFCCKMSKKHDENKDIRLVSRIAKIDYANKTIQAPKSAIIGIKTWGRIDYLTNYCGWFFIWNNEVLITGRHNSSDDNDSKKRKRDAKKLTKDNSLIPKKKKRRI